MIMKILLIQSYQNIKKVVSKMKTEIIQAWKDYSLFEMKLNEKIKTIEQYYEIIDIKYSTFYDNVNKQWNYSALIIFKDKVDE